MSRPLRFALLSCCLMIAPSAFAGDGSREVSVPLGSGVELKMVQIEAGTFQQGSPETEAGRGVDETLREVRLTQPFYLGKFPVTRGQFARFAADSGYRTEAEVGKSGGFGWDGTKLAQHKEFSWRNPGFAQSDDDPVVIVTFNDAKAFLAWLARKTGGSFQFPTEAQWEYACRAGSQTAYPTGDGASAADDAAWHKGNAGQGTKAVGQKALNAWGLGDMNGNVWEWCADWFGPYAVGAQTDPIQENSGLSDKPRRVLRGGSWLREASFARSATRYRNDAQSRNADNGFRVMAYDLGGKKAAVAPQPPAVALERTTQERDEMPAREPFPLNAVPGAKPQTSAADVWWGTGLLGCTCFGTILVVVAVISVFRRTLRGSSPSTPDVRVPGMGVQPGKISNLSGPLHTRVVDDGFWIEGQVSAGTLVACRYLAEGRQQEMEVTLDGLAGGQFIYTGARPSNVSVVVVPDLRSTTSSITGGMMPPGQPINPTADNVRRRRTPPSAY